MDKGRYIWVCEGPGKELKGPAGKSISPHNETIMRGVWYMFVAKGPGRITWKKYVSKRGVIRRQSHSASNSIDRL